MKHVFVSYAQANADFAELLRSQLESNGMTAWLATELKAGEDWRQGIDDAIKSSFALVVVISPEADQSKYVTYEWAFAYGIGIQIVPILFQNLPTGNKIHPRLEGLQYENFTHTINTHRPWSKLIKRLQEIQQIVDSKEKSDPRVKEVIVALNGWRLNDRIEAARALGRFKANSAVPSLIDALQDQDTELQLASAQALGDIGDSQAAESLIAKFTDSNSDLRKACAIALRKIGDLSFGENFIKLLDDRSCEIRLVAVRAIGNFKTKSATPKLLELLIKLANQELDCPEEDDDEFFEHDYPVCHNG